MSPGRTRHFGGRSRITNTTVSKRRQQSRSALDRYDNISKVLLSSAPIEDCLHEDGATRSLTPLDLGLAPFKIEQNEDPFLDDNVCFSAPYDLSSDVVDEDKLEDVLGMPTRVQWKALVDAYLASLHSSKRHKSLISQEVYNMIFRTLKNPDATRLGTPQFRFWARKMFQLVEAPNDPEVLVVTNGGRPVAIKEHIYDILCMCHSECGHGGRDKTCKVLREYYTWIPKELISNFVKVCPTCEPRRNMALKSKDRKIASDLALARREGTSTGSSRFSVERLEDFGQLPSPFPDESRQLKLPSFITDQPSVPVSHPDRFSLVDYALETSFIPSIASTEYPSPIGSLPSPPWTGSIILPPLISSVETGEIELNNAGSGVGRNIVLPPLMQYLSQSRDNRDEFHCARDEQLGYQSQTAHIPIDPSLLVSQGRPFSSHGGNALQLELHPPSPQNNSRPNTQLSLDPSFPHQPNGESETGKAVYEFPSVDSGYDRQFDNSALLSASTASLDLQTPSSSGQISPVGLKHVTPSHSYASESQHEINGGVLYTHDQGLIMNSNAGAESDPTWERAMQAPCTGSPPLFSPLPFRAESVNTILELAAAVEADS